MIVFRRKAGLTLSLALGIAACSGTPKVAPPVAAPVVPVSPVEIDAILGQLNRGEVDAASAAIAAALKREPMNPSLQLLRDSVERDPKELLGPENYSYTVRPGDTMISLSERFLGNRLKAYQLARYNSITNPSLLAPGQHIRIPGDAPRAEPTRRPEPRPSTTPAPTKPRPAAPKPAAVPQAAPTANPAAARQMRAAGLAALNQGKVMQAVGMLRRASALSPGDPAIARDLARAERIAATVRSRR